MVIKEDNNLIILAVNRQEHGGPNNEDRQWRIRV